MLERALRDAHFAVDPKRSAKQQALEVLVLLLGNTLPWLCRYAFIASVYNMLCASMWYWLSEIRFLTCTTNDHALRIWALLVFSWVCFSVIESSSPGCISRNISCQHQCRTHPIEDTEGPAMQELPRMQAIPVLQRVIALRRADMRLKIQVSLAAENQLELLLREHRAIIERQEVSATQVQRERIMVLCHSLQSCTLLRSARLHSYTQQHRI